MLRCVIGAVNLHPDFEHCEFTPLWHTLTLMKLQAQGNGTYYQQLPAWAQVRFKRTQTGKAICEHHVGEESSRS